jgi:hypothetical protein
MRPSARLRSRPVISVEAHGAEHREQGRETLEELKIARDMFLLCGAGGPACGEAHG